eukprot:1177077-Prorocentrum_minimum.AAC.1
MGGRAAQVADAIRKRRALVLMPLPPRVASRPATRAGTQPRRTPGPPPIASHPFAAQAVQALPLLTIIDYSHPGLTTPRCPRQPCPPPLRGEGPDGYHQGPPLATPSS